MPLHYRLFLAAFLLMGWYTAVRLHMAASVSDISRPLESWPAGYVVSDWKRDISGPETRTVIRATWLHTSGAVQARTDNGTITVDRREVKYSLSVIGWLICVWGFFIAMMLGEAAIRVFGKRLIPPAATARSV